MNAPPPPPPPELLDYALGLLDEPDHERVEQALARDPALAERVEKVRCCLRHLCDDCDELEPPADLARRTLRLVAQAQQARRPVLDLAPARAPFRWGDLAVAASIFVVGLLMLGPALHRSRRAAGTRACALNLRTIGMGLAQYAAANGHYPYGETDCPGPFAGVFAVRLNEAGYLPDATVLDCPCNGPSPLDTLPSLASYCADERRNPGGSPCLKHLDYAYHLDYRDHGAFRPISQRLPYDHHAGRFALLSDRPDFDARRGVVREGNSPNHGGSGQNLLFADGHVGWNPDRRLGPVDPDIFLNADHRVAPGRVPTDFVLAPGVVPFQGR